MRLQFPSCFQTHSNTTGSGQTHCLDTSVKNAHIFLMVVAGGGEQASQRTHLSRRAWQRMQSAPSCRHVHAFFSSRDWPAEARRGGRTCSNALLLYYCTTSRQRICTACATRRVRSLEIAPLKCTSACTVLCTSYIYHSRTSRFNHVHAPSRKLMLLKKVKINYSLRVFDGILDCVNCCV